MLPRATPDNSPGSSTPVPPLDGPGSGASHEPRAGVIVVLRAIGFGALAAIAGACIYIAVVAITGFYVGILLVAIGHLVGYAVRRASRGRGGWGFQAVAIVLTYLGIAGTYLPLVARELQRPPARVARPMPTPIADTITISARGPDVGRAIDSVAAAKRTGEFAATQAGTPRSQTHNDAAPPLDVGTIVLGAGALMVIASVLPIAVGFKNVMNLLIVAVALFEAWRLNRRGLRGGLGNYRAA